MSGTLVEHHVVPKDVRRRILGWISDMTGQQGHRQDPSRRAGLESLRLEPSVTDAHVWLTLVPDRTT